MRKKCTHTKPPIDDTSMWTHVSDSGYTNPKLLANTALFPSTTAALNANLWCVVVSEWKSISRDISLSLALTHRYEE